MCLVIFFSMIKGWLRDEASRPKKMDEFGIYCRIRVADPDGSAIRQFALER